MILSGMNAAEVGEIIGAYRDAGNTPHAATWVYVMMHFNFGLTYVVEKAWHFPIAACASQPTS